MNKYLYDYCLSKYFVIFEKNVKYRKIINNHQNINCNRYPILQRITKKPRFRGFSSYSAKYKNL